MTIFNSVFTWFMKKRIHQIELFMKYPNEVQEEWFEQLISGAENTEWGKKYGYKSITHLAQFKARVPIQNYDTLKPYIERMLKGEQNVLWPSEIRWFAKSSGTTSDRSKYIPVSEEALEECHFKGGKDLLTIYFNNQPNSKMFTGKILTLGGSYQVSQLSADTSFGDLSAVLMNYHRNVMSEYMGLVVGQYDAKAEGFVPGGGSLHNCMSAHGPDSDTYEQASKAELQPKRYENTLAFMFESRYVIRPTRFAMEIAALQQDYLACWSGLKKHFKV